MTDQVELSKLFMAIAQVTGKEADPKHIRTAMIGQKILEIIDNEKLETTEVLFMLIDMISFLLFITAKDPSGRQIAATALAIELIKKANQVDKKEFDALEQAVSKKMEGQGQEQ